MGVIVTASMVGKAKLDLEKFLGLIAALAEDHYAEGPYFVVGGPSCKNLDPFLGTDALRHMPDSALLVDNASIAQVRDIVRGSGGAVDLVVGFGWVRANDAWDLLLSEAQDPEEREEMYEEVERSSDACGALYYSSGTAELRIVGKAAPAELDYGDKVFFAWLAPWLGKVRHRVRMD